MAPQSAQPANEQSPVCGAQDTVYEHRQLETITVIVVYSILALKEIPYLSLVDANSAFSRAYDG